MRSSNRHNHVCQIFSQSVQGSRATELWHPKIAVSQWLTCRPNCRRHCDKTWQIYANGNAQHCYKILQN